MNPTNNGTSNDVANPNNVVTANDNVAPPFLGQGTRSAGADSAHAPNSLSKTRNLEVLVLIIQIKVIVCTRLLLLFKER